VRAYYFLLKTLSDKLPELIVNTLDDFADDLNKFNKGINVMDNPAYKEFTFKVQKGTRAAETINLLSQVMYEYQADADPQDQDAIAVWFYRTYLFRGL